MSEEKTASLASGTATTEVTPAPAGATVAGETPAPAEAPATRETPAATETPATEVTPAPAEVTTTGETPATAEIPSAGETPAATETPATEVTPAPAKSVATEKTPAPAKQDLYDAHEEYTKKYIEILDVYKDHIKITVDHKKTLKTSFFKCLCAAMFIMLVGGGYFAFSSLGVLQTVINNSRPVVSIQGSQTGNSGQNSSAGQPQTPTVNALVGEKCNEQDNDSYSQVNVAVIGAISAMIASFASILTAVLVLPKIVAEYLFDKEEDKNMTQIIKGIQAFEVDSQRMSLVRHAKIDAAIAQTETIPDEDLEDSPNDKNGQTASKSA